MAADSEKNDRRRGYQDLREVQAVNLNHVLSANFPCKDKYTTHITYNCVETGSIVSHGHACDQVTCHSSIYFYRALFRILLHVTSKWN